MTHSTDKNTKVSIIIPVFNDPKGIDSALISLAKQQWPMDKLEVLVIDNGSTPPLNISQHYPFELKIIRCLQPGSYAARNSGIKVAQHNILAFTDADCTPSPFWISSGVRYLLDTEKKIIIGGNVIVTPPTPRTAAGIYQYIVGFQQRENILLDNFTVTANLICKKNALTEIGLFNSSLLSGGDKEWCWRALNSGYDIRYSPETIVTTPPRTSFASAALQTRRVAAGREQMKKHKLSGPSPHKKSFQRTPLQSALWIYGHPELTLQEKLSVLLVAAMLKILSKIEKFKISLGGKAERR